MRLSKAHIKTLREIPGEAEIPSHIWLLRAGMIRKTVSGVYGFMTFGWRTVRKIEQIVREEMDLADAQEILMSALQPAELWHESGRWQVYGPELWRVKDRHDRAFCLGPTAEEIFTDIVRNEVDSYRQLPLNLYQIQTKYRDEARPRFGLMRSREFIMKDAYSFDRDEAGLDVSYLKMREAYNRVFTRCGLSFRPVIADSGAMGGKDTEEFTALCDYGENDIVYCDACDFAANTESAAGVDAAPVSEELLPVTEVHTPGTKTIEAVADFVGLPKEKTLKALLFAVYREPAADGETGGTDKTGRPISGKPDGGLDHAAGDVGGAVEYVLKEYVAVFIRGDRELNMTKLMNALGVQEHLIEFADEAQMGLVTGAVGGFTGPIGLHDVKILTDSELPGLKNLCAGANKIDYHLTNVNYGRDYEADIVTDLKLVKAGDPCPVCGKPLAFARGIEVGQIFKLGTKYSASMGATYKDENQEEHLIVMGCYGIGVTRTMAAVVEQNHDDKGIIWPVPIAPYHVIVTLVKPDDETQRRVAENLYAQFQAAGVEVILDDRDERPGVKFNDADIFGIPIRITVGKKAADGLVEYKLRRGTEVLELDVAEATARAIKLVQTER
ncbi:MAG: proline--tRNA ligase [Clostridiales Family XIII bacterium]|jgi:prolyl-tRNA synthetase|nr:proline--tRNA ligase [Clostridiales Family XIII bacterium]